MSIVLPSVVPSKSAPRTNEETHLFSRLLIEESRMLPDVIKAAREAVAGDEESARVQLVARLPELVKAALPHPQESFTNGCIWCCMGRIDFSLLAQLVCEVWTVDAVAEYEANERDEIETRIEIMEAESEIEDAERFDGME